MLIAAALALSPARSELVPIALGLGRDFCYSRAEYPIRQEIKKREKRWAQIYQARMTRTPTGSGGYREVVAAAAKGGGIASSTAAPLIGKLQRGRATMERLSSVMLAVAACVAAGLGIAGPVSAEQKEVVIGGTCDRTGPTQINGVGICPGIQDYYDLINTKGGVEGYRIKYLEIDHEYKVPQGVEAYEREKRDGAVSMMVYGTPQSRHTHGDHGGSRD